jgi:AraC-like DNA-binding protein
MGSYQQPAPQGKLNQVVRLLSTLLDARTSLFAPDGSQLLAGGERPNCNYCKYLQEYLDARDQCRAFDAQKPMEVARKQEAITYRCPGGLTGAAAPVILNGRLSGVISINQFRQTDKMPSDMATRWNKKFHDDRLEKAFLEAPCYAPGIISDVLGLLSVLVKCMSSQRPVEVSHDPIAYLLEYMADHPEEMLTLKEAAAMVHRSTSSVAHEFRNTTGKSFRQFQIDKKLDLADQYFNTAPTSSVSQVAARVGYRDPLYFSRVYRKHRGYPPTATVERLRADGSEGRRK